MSKIKKIGLFLSSFSPLFALIIIKEITEIINGNWTFNFLNTSICVLLLIFLFFGITCFILILNNIKKFKSSKIEIKSKTNITDQHFLGYFSIFVLFAVTFEIEMYSMALIFLIILTLIGIVYVRNDMYYINPLINILGYSFYDIEFFNDKGELKKNRVFHKGRLIIGKKYEIQDKFSNFIFLCDNNKKEIFL